VQLKAKRGATAPLWGIFAHLRLDMASLRTCPGLEDGKRNILGQQIRSLRKGAGFNQVSFIVHLQKCGWDIDPATLRRMESGKRTIADFELRFILKSLKLNWSDLE